MQKCKKCGKKMNIPKGHADFCYDCTYNKTIKSKVKGRKK